MASSKRKGKKTRGAGWGDTETKSLITFWGENNIEEQMDDPQVNKHRLYEDVCKSLRALGYEKTVEQVKTKIHTLKRTFRKTKADMKTSGKGRNVCRFYNELNDILGKRPMTSPLKVIESSKVDTQDDSDSNTINENFEIDGFDPVPLSDDDESLIEEQHDTKSTPDTSVDVEKPSTSTEQTPGTSVDKPSTSTKSDDTSDPKTASKVQLKRTSAGPGDGSKTKRNRKTKMETALSAVMEGFVGSNERIEDKFVNLEERKLDVEMKKLDMDKVKLEMEAQQKREEREHQYRMMNMIMTRLAPVQAMQQPQPSYPPASVTRSSPWQQGGGPNFNISYDDKGDCYQNL